VSGGLERLHGRVVHASRVLSWVAIGALLVVCAAVLVDVTLRWIVNRPVHGLEDITALVITVAIAACFPAGFALGTHITVRATGTFIGPRTHAWLDVLGQGVTLFFIALLAWQALVYASDVALRKSLILGLPIAPAWRIAAAFMALAALVQVLVVAARVETAWRGGGR
jgi:TRAP-type C4-dicarboxylate transport system permease small subunit